MRCPRCNSGTVITQYARDEDGWMKEIYCSECHYNEIMDIPEDESLEDFAERQAQRISWSLQQDIVNCFRNGRDYEDGYLLEADGLGLVDITITIKKTSWEERGKK